MPLCSAAIRYEGLLAGLEAKVGHKAGETSLAHAAHHCDGVVAAMLALRRTVDELEGIVADDLWPLTTYQEMLFIK